jgi:hypothetical protein
MQASLLLHAESHELDEVPSVCHQSVGCDFRCTTGRMLKGRRLKVPCIGANFFCSECTAPFATEVALQAHTAATHDGNNVSTWICSESNRQHAFPNAKARDVHFLKYHSSVSIPTLRSLYRLYYRKLLAEVI